MQQLLSSIAVQQLMAIAAASAAVAAGADTTAVYGELGVHQDEGCMTGMLQAAVKQLP